MSPASRAGVEAPAPPAAAVRCRGLVRSFGEREVLRGVELDVAPGELVLLTGPNGAGKTTLLRVLATVLRPSAGEAAVLGHALPAAAALARPGVGYLGHEPLTYAALSARENLELYAALYGLPAARVEEALAAVGLAARARERVSQLSRGMRQRLALARATLQRPALLLLDEPTAALDAEAQELLRGRLERRSCAVVAATHEPDWFEGLSARRLELVDGRLAA